MAVPGTNATLQMAAVARQGQLLPINVARKWLENPLRWRKDIWHFCRPGF